MITQPFIVHRVSTKVFTNYELSLLKYPKSHLVGTEIRPTSKVTMETNFNYYTSDNLETVLEYMEEQLPGFVQLQGSWVIVEPTYRNTIGSEETAFRFIFQYLEKGMPGIAVYIYPSDIEGTSIRISEKWSSMGFPAWLRRW